jgi:hypothetical protein
LFELEVENYFFLDADGKKNEISDGNLHTTVAGTNRRDT